jgi:hypothetical protein
MVLIIVLLRRCLEEKIVQAHTDTAHNEAWTVDLDMSELFSDLEEEVVAGTQIILQQLALLITTSSSLRYRAYKRQLERVSISKRRFHSLRTSLRKLKNAINGLRVVFGIIIPSLKVHLFHTPNDSFLYGSIRVE